MVGAVLFPAKKKIATALKSFIEDELEAHETPIAIGVFLLPFKGLVNSGEYLIYRVITHIKIIGIGLCSVTFLRIFFYVAPRELFSTLLDVVLWHHTFFGKFAGSLSVSLVLVILVAYAIAIFMLWTSTSASVFTMIGQGLWILIAAYLCSFMGSFQVAAFVGVMTYAFVAFICDEENQMVEKLRKVFAKDEPRTPTEPTNEPNPEIYPATPLAARLLRTKNHLSEMKQKMQLSFQKEEKLPKKPKEKEIILESDGYFKILFYSCTATILWTQMWIFFLCLIPITFYAIKELFVALGFWNFIEERWRTRYSQTFNNWFEQRRTALLPGTIEIIILF